MAICALIFGIVGIILFWVPYFNVIPLILSVVGIVLAAMAMKKAKAEGQPSGLAVAGLVLSIIGTVLAFIGACACTICPACTCLCAGESAAAGASMLEDMMMDLM